MILTSLRKYLTLGVAVIAALTLIYAAVTHLRLKDAKIVISSLNGEITRLEDVSKRNQQTISILEENDRMNREYRKALKARYEQLEVEHETLSSKAKRAIPVSDLECLNRNHPVEFNQLFQRPHGGGNKDNASQTGQ